MQSANDGFEPFRYVAVPLAHRSRLGIGDAAENAEGRFRSKWRMAGRHGVQHTAQTEKIAAMVKRLAASLLGRHVLRRAGNHTAASQTGVVSGSSQPEIRDANSLHIAF